jgi:hypothetical protein
VDGLELAAEMRANFGEASGDLRSLSYAESRERLVETEIRSWHDREVDYTEGHDISCPYGRKAPTRMAALQS